VAVEVGDAVDPAGRQAFGRGGRASVLLLLERPLRVVGSVEHFKGPSQGPREPSSAGVNGIFPFIKRLL